MGTKLFVGGINYDTTEDNLRNGFAQAGNVTSCSIILDKMTGRSKGFGFVEMASAEEANAAIEMWNGKELDGRRLTVNEARPMQPRAPRQGGGYGNRGGFGGGHNDNGGSW